MYTHTQAVSQTDNKYYQRTSRTIMKLMTEAIFPAEFHNGTEQPKSTNQSRTSEFNQQIIVNHLFGWHGTNAHAPHKLLPLKLKYSSDGNASLCFTFDPSD